MTIEKRLRELAERATPGSRQVDIEHGIVHFGPTDEDGERCAYDVWARQKGIPLTVYAGQQHLPTPSDESLPAAITRVYDELKRRRPSLPDYSPGSSETRLVLWTRQPEPVAAVTPKRAARRKATTKQQKEAVGEH